MINKIKIKASPSDTRDRTFNTDLIDLGFTKETWENLSDMHKRNIIQEFLDNMPEQPYWSLNSFEE